MLRKILFLLQLVIVISATAQVGVEETNTIHSPISVSSKYSSKIDLLSLPFNFTTPSFDNDSLYRDYNKGYHPSSASYVSGFGKIFEADKWFKESSSCIVLDTGTVWIFKANTITGVGVNISLDSLTIPEGAQLSYFYFDSEGSMVYFINGHDIDMSMIQISPFRIQTLYIEYFEPKSFKNPYNFKIFSWGYTFSYQMRQIKDSLLLPHSRVIASRDLMLLTTRCNRAATVGNYKTYRI